MKIFFRVDASIEMGTGHLMRCLTLAEALRDKGAQVSFISRELRGNMCNFTGDRGYKVYRLPHLEPLIWPALDRQTDAAQTKAILAPEPDVEWLVVDHYALDRQWEMQMRPHVRKIMAIDDLADRRHDCDLLLDQNLYRKMETRYNGLVSGQCVKLLGPRYALLRPEFRVARKNLRKRDGRVRRVLIFFGGTDPTNETTKALEAVRLLNRPEIAVDVVVGNTNPHREYIQKLCTAISHPTFYCQADNMPLLMAGADLAIGAGGSATWERCFLGLPTLTVVVAENQRETTSVLADSGVVWNLGWYENVTVEDLLNGVKLALGNPGFLKNMGSKALALMSCSPGTDYIAALMMEGSDAKV